VRSHSGQLSVSVIRPALTPSLARCAGAAEVKINPQHAPRPTALARMSVARQNGYRAAADVRESGRAKIASPAFTHYQLVCHSSHSESACQGALQPVDLSQKQREDLPVAGTSRLSTWGVSAQRAHSLQQRPLVTHIHQHSTQHTASSSANQ